MSTPENRINVDVSAKADSTTYGWVHASSTINISQYPPTKKDMKKIRTKILDFVNKEHDEKIYTFVCIISIIPLAD